MSFTIKCDKCGNVRKYEEDKTTYKQTDKAITIHRETEGDAMPWYVITCNSCGHEVVY
jgi:predicted nucleic-acid-binding Zn-ribbon protein